MDKIELLRCLITSDLFPFLSNGELKLYILLLISTDKVGCANKISFKQIERIGRKLSTLKKLKQSMTTLEKHGLVVFEKIELWPHGELSYMLKKPFDPPTTQDAKSCKDENGKSR